MHFTLVKCCAGGIHTPDLFDDVILPVYFALTRLGYTVECKANQVNKHSTNILFGSCRAPSINDYDIPASSIIYNFEQLTSNTKLATEAYLRHLSRCNVWDYSQRNIRYMRDKLGIKNAVEVPVGYVPEMTRLRQDFPQDIDILFYGAMNPRRERILEQLCTAGLTVCILSGNYGAFGRERDLAIARAKLIVNIHFYTPGTLEMPRLGYLMANSKAVVSEFGPETERYEGLEDAALYSEYENIVSGALVLLKKDAARKALGKSALKAFSSISLERILQNVVGRRTSGSAALSLPTCLHAGSGKNFRQAALNIDINPTCLPDVVLDLSQALDSEAVHQTRRFGLIHLQPGTFTRITANDVLGHVLDLPRTMTNFLTLLADGGVLEIIVPYDLSLGAWQEPSHVRSFNENSWLYYTKWAWYLGWRDERFSQESLSFTYSALGLEMLKSGRTHEEIIRMPRMVDSMHVVLRKRAATEAEKTEYDLWFRSFYDGPLEDWALPESDGAKHGQP